MRYSEHPMSRACPCGSYAIEGVPSKDGGYTYRCRCCGLSISGNTAEDAWEKMAEFRFKQRAVASKWISKEVSPDPDRMVLVFSPCYEEKSGMRWRMIQGQFIKTVTDVTHWMYPDEPCPK